MTSLFSAALVMATDNVSGDEKQNTFMLEQIYRPSDVTALIHGQMNFLLPLNIFF